MQDRDATVGLLAELAFGDEAGAYIGHPVASWLVAFASGIRAHVAAVTAEGDGRGAAVLETAIVEELETVVRHLTYHLDRCHEMDPERAPTAADGFALGRAYARARLSLPAPFLRPVLRNALVSALAPPGAFRTDPFQVLASAARLPDDPDASREPSADGSVLEPIPPGWRPPWQRVPGIGAAGPATEEPPEDGP